MSRMSSSRMVFGDLADESSSDGIPSPSPFTAEGRREWNREQAQRKQSLESAATHPNSSTTKEPAAKKARMEMSSASALDMDQAAGALQHNVQGQEEIIVIDSETEQSSGESNDVQNSVGALRQTVKAERTPQSSQDTLAEPAALTAPQLECVKAFSRAPGGGIDASAHLASSEATIQKQRQEAEVEPTQDATSEGKTNGPPQDAAEGKTASNSSSCSKSSTRTQPSPQEQPPQDSVSLTKSKGSPQAPRKESYEAASPEEQASVGEAEPTQDDASSPETIESPPQAPAEDSTSPHSPSKEVFIAIQPLASPVEPGKDATVTVTESAVSRVDVDSNPPVTRKRSPIAAVVSQSVASQTKEKGPSTRKRSSDGLLSGEGKASSTDQKKAKAAPSRPVRSTRKKSPTNPPQDAPPKKSDDAADQIVTKYVNLYHLPQNVKRVAKLNREQLEELERALMFGEEGWRDDWMGNLLYLHKEVPNPATVAKPKPGAATLPFWEWAVTAGAPSRRLLQHLFMHVYHMDGTPERAKQILADAVQNYKDDPGLMASTVHRLSYDPVVLRQDGWVTAKAASPQGASGGAYHIGAHLIWQKYEAVVIAYDHDFDIGDLWKCMWLEEFETFDLEAEELHRAMTKYQKKKQQQQGTAGRQTSTGSAVGASSSSRFTATSNYSVEGIEYGIVLASSYHPHARMGVLWPARVMHVSEVTTSPLQTKRSSSKNKVHVVFLAPYWNGRPVGSTGGRRVVESYGNNPSQVKNMYTSGELLEVDTVEVSEDTIHKYPYDGDELNIEQLRAAFKFLGLPKPAFSRFLDSHRLAMALKTFAQYHVKQPKTAREDTKAMASLADTHAMAIMSPIFPPAVLHLPFNYILDHLPPPAPEQSYALDSGEEHLEPVVQLNSILDMMKPPNCWGQTQANGDVHHLASTPSKSLSRQEEPDSPAIMSPQPSLANGDSHVSEAAWSLNSFVSDFLLNEIVDHPGESSPFHRLGNDLKDAVARILRDSSAAEHLDYTSRREKLSALLSFCLTIKNHGEDIICSGWNCAESYGRKIRMEWRKACERIYKRAVLRFSTSDFGDGVTLVVTDSRCNEHVTESGCVERPVRLPAALKGAKMAGAGSSPKIQIMFPVEDKYTKLAENKVLAKAHKSSYLKRMKARCRGLAPNAKSVPLTEDSDGQGGEDTMGSRGTYDAAVAGVAAALQAVDHIVGGRCTNAFCATRPPGHHAGRDLHPMKAVSNGFCVLNPVACAALYATTPQSEGGPGLRRVCVIDFDVHHGNGTQDILCSTYDPRFLYVSVHAGGAHINGYEGEDDDSTFTPGSTQKNGIYPGRCGDTCPHEGVLNIPMGARVTAHDVGTVLVTQVTPAVEAFSPDLIILSAGFDAHKNDPLGMGGLSAQDFGSITDVACSMAFRSCSGRVLSVLEGGYGIPCCRPQTDLFLPTPPLSQSSDDNYITSQASMSVSLGPSVQQQYKVFDLDEEIPDNMEDQLPPGLRRKVDKCHSEGFVDCVKEHISSLSKHNTRKT